MKKTRFISYVTLYSFLICMAMTMGVFASTIANFSAYTNLFYYTHNPMLEKTSFQQAYLSFNEDAMAEGEPIVTEIYFDSYRDSTRSSYDFTEEGRRVYLQNLKVRDVSEKAQENILAYYYSYYNTEFESQVGAMFILTTETLMLPVDSSNLFRASKLYIAGDDNEKVSALTKIVFNNVNTSATTNMAGMFYECEKLTTIEGIDKFDTSQSTLMRSMFFRCIELKSLDVSNFKTGKVQDFSHMFSYCSKLSVIDVSDFDTSAATTLAAMFSACSVKQLDLSKFNTSNVIHMNNMFTACWSLSSLDVSNFNTSKVTNMYAMFSYTGSLKSLDLTSFDTSNVENMARMFHACPATLNISHFNTSSATNMRAMFQGASGVDMACLTKFDTSKVTNMAHMFDSTGYEMLDLSNFDTSKVENMHNMFANCKNLETIYVSKKWTVSAVTEEACLCEGDGSCYAEVPNNQGIFSKCSSLPNWEANGGVDDKTYAYAGGDGKGYLLFKS